MRQPWHSKYRVLMPNGVPWSHEELSLDEARACKANAERIFQRRGHSYDLIIDRVVEGVMP